MKPHHYGGDCPFLNSPMCCIDKLLILILQQRSYTKISVLYKYTKYSSVSLIIFSLLLIMFMDKQLKDCHYLKNTTHNINDEN